MSLTLRYLGTDPRVPSFSALAVALQRADARFKLVANPAAVSSEARVVYGRKAVAALSLGQRERFTAQLTDLEERVREQAGRAGEAVLQRLGDVRWVLLVELLGGGIDAEATLARLDPLVSWVMAEREGMLQVDGEGFYDASGPLLALD
ncbi:MAG: hypothetical protein L0Y66_11410 [Myxococcaceae bacterium]|nr:hypothetical protein [Myxococcaceae bacterium]MCI0673949.1 hypothetical protein [Myxococcaceae bacterium]